MATNSSLRIRLPTRPCHFLCHLAAAYLEHTASRAGRLANPDQSPEIRGLRDEWPDLMFTIRWTLAARCRREEQRQDRGLDAAMCHPALSLGDHRRFDGNVVYVVVTLVWLTVGAAVGVIEARHGHWRRGWVVSAIFGPFAVPLALQRRREIGSMPAVLVRGRARRGTVDLLIGLDGSTTSMAAAELALRLFGPRVGRVALATVLDLDTTAPHADSALYPEPWPEEGAAREQLESAAATLRGATGREPTAVVLAGEPSDALERYAIDQGYEVIVVGCRGKGVSKLLLGSCASKLARKTAVPVLLIPRDPGAPVPEVTTTASSAFG